jgi:Xaa-Pro aminopeptidase
MNPLLHTHTTPFDPSIYAERRTRLAKALGPNAVAIIPTAPERPRNRDADFPYRFDSYFFYLCGFTEPNACLVIDASGHTRLLCQPKDTEREIWDGYRLGPQEAPSALGVAVAEDIRDMDRFIPQWLENKDVVWWPFATHERLSQQVDGWLDQVRAKARTGVRCPDTQRDLCALMDNMRVVKDRHELDTMRRASAISAGAHIRAMQRSARDLRAGADLREYHLEAELLHAFRDGGSQFPAYTSIVAAGANACVLHYRAGNAAVKSGDLVLIDAGCELDGYASDITRTFPASGRFSGPQRDVYALVLASQDAAVAATRAGARFNDPHEATLKVLAQGLLDLGILKGDLVGSADDVIANKAYTPFYMHRTSHWLGLDVHDCGAYSDPAMGDAAPQSRTLASGMVLTIEPGLYIRPQPDVPEAFHHIGIRIEDDAVVTDVGCELITRGVPVAIDAIEALMAD